MNFYVYCWVSNTGLSQYITYPNLLNVLEYFRWVTTLPDSLFRNLVTMFQGKSVININLGDVSVTRPTILKPRTRVPGHHKINWFIIYESYNMTYIAQNLERFRLSHVQSVHNEHAKTLVNNMSLQPKSDRYMTCKMQTVQYRLLASTSWYWKPVNDLK